MSESEFLEGEITKKHLVNAAPTDIDFAAIKGDDVPWTGCDTYFTINCGPTAKPRGACDQNWVRENPPPDWFKEKVKRYGPPKWWPPPPEKKPSR